MPETSSFQQLREQRHARWLADLKGSIRALLESEPLRHAPQPEQIYLFGSRARGDWDGLSDTDLLVVARTTRDAEHWADRIMDGGLAQDVIGIDREAWQQLPQHSSVIWRHVARDAQPLLEGEA